MWHSEDHFVSLFIEVRLNSVAGLPLISMRAGPDSRVFAGVSKSTRSALMQWSWRVYLQVLYTGESAVGFSYWGLSWEGRFF